MKIVTYNIRYATGRDDVVDVDRIAREVAGADVIALQEVDRFWPRSGDVDQVAALSERFPAHHAEYGAGVNVHDDARDESGRVVHRRRQFGNLTLSRFPIRYSRHHLLPKYASTGPVSIQRSALECLIECELGALRIVNTHLTHLSAETRLPQIERLLDVHRRAEFEGQPVCGDLEGAGWDLDEPLPAPPRRSIFLGDFNMEPGSAEYTAMTGPLSSHGGRIGNPTLLMDAWCAAGHAEHEGATSNIRGRLSRLDYIFISPSLAPSIRDCRIDVNATGSDHQPLWLELG